MTELKTLNDLIWSEQKINKDIQDRLKLLESPEEKREPIKQVVHIDYEELKQEAIKWIKEIQSLKPTDNFVFKDETIGPFQDKQLDKESIIVWIRMFFNITDEDLK